MDTIYKTNIIVPYWLHILISKTIMYDYSFSFLNANIYPYQ